MFLNKKSKKELLNRIEELEDFLGVVFYVDSDDYQEYIERPYGAIPDLRKKIDEVAEAKGKK